MFLSFSLFYLEGYRSDWMISPLVAFLAILIFNRVLLSERFKLFSMLSRRLLHNLIWLFVVLVERFLIAASPRFFFSCPKFSILALRIDFRLGSSPVCFWLSACFCICLWYALDFACIVQHLPAANRMTSVWHVFATVTGRRGCVSCCTRASFERGFSCIPRFGTWSAMLVLLV